MDRDFSYNVSHTIDEYANKRQRVEDTNQVEDVATFECDCCGRPLSSGEIRFKCAECINFHMCQSCFTSGKEAKSHLKIHPYRVFHNLGALRLPDSTWGLDEEILLLEGIELYGFGNWNGVSSHLTSREAEECEKHYMDKYVFGFAQVKPIVKTKQELAKEKKIEAKLHKDMPNLPGVGMAGYMPLREDFDVEYSNNAEKIITGLKFDVDEVRIGQTEENFSQGPKKKSDILQSRKMKLKLVKTYNRTLDEREYRKEFVKKFDLLDMDKRKQARKYSKEEKVVRSQLRPVAQYMSYVEHEDLVRGVLQENELRNRIEELKMYRKRGLESFKQIEAYKNFEKKQRNAYAHSYNTPNDVPRKKARTVETDDGLESDSTKKSKSRSRRARRNRVNYAEDSCEEKSVGSESASIVSDDTSNTRSTIMASSCTDPNTRLQNNTPILANLSQPAPQIRTQPSAEELEQMKQETMKINAALAKNAHKKMETPNVPSDTPNVLALCQALKIHPTHYSEAKNHILEECMKKKILKKSGNVPVGNKQEILLVDMHKTGNVIDYSVRVATS